MVVLLWWVVWWACDSDSSCLRFHGAPSYPVGCNESVCQTIVLLSDPWNDVAGFWFQDFFEGIRPISQRTLSSCLFCKRIRISVPCTRLCLNIFLVGVGTALLLMTEARSSCRVGSGGLIVPCCALVDSTLCFHRAWGASAASWSPCWLPTC